MSNEQKNHPAFPQPSDPNVRVWRYMDFDKFNWLVEFKRLFMPSPEWLADPLEGTRPTGDSEWWRRKAEIAEIEEERKIYQRNYQILSEFEESFRPHYFVSCWNENDRECRELWDHYTNGPDSIVVQSRYSVLNDLLPPCVILGVVRYIDYESDELPDLNLMHLISHKDTQYSFESEVRAVMFGLQLQAVDPEQYGENVFVLDAKKDLHFYAPEINVQRLIEKIVLHPNASTEFRGKVAKMCVDNGLPEPELSDFSYSDRRTHQK